MFQVQTSSPLDDEWEDRDRVLIDTAGRPSDYAGAGQESGKAGFREHVWFVREFDDAQEMKKQLERIPLVKITVREQ